MLTEPLAYAIDLLPNINQYEAACVLGEIWRYMQVSLKFAYFCSSVSLQYSLIFSNRANCISVMQISCISIIYALCKRCMHMTFITQLVIGACRCVVCSLGITSEISCD
jgi:hypothetical protein